MPPFADFLTGPRQNDPLRDAITRAHRRPEPESLAPLLTLATVAPEAAAGIAALARDLVERLRAKGHGRGIKGLMQEYALSSNEGVALMCLAEALLRIPDAATRDALIRDKIAAGDWQSHIGHSPSMFVNATTWALIVTGHLTSTSSEEGLVNGLTRLIERGSEPLIRKGVDLAMRMMGEQFVSGQTIDEALSNGRRMEEKGFRYSYDMLGEAAMTADDAAHYLASYEAAIHAIGTASGGRGIYDGPGISIKLSALHPRFTRSQKTLVMTELLPRLKALALLAKGNDIGINIDAEEADRLDLSLDLLEALCRDPDLAGWNGIGFVIQAYQKRCAFVVDWLVTLGRQTNRRIMVRLVKGAYWDSEIKRAQVDGLDDFPVFTRKVHTDVSYLACARKLLATPDAIFPQFATHNAQTLASIVTMAGPNFYQGQYEFQCLHGMGEALYEEVVGAETLNRPCRIYAPVGTHETLLAYLVRRLLENGANTSFVNQIADHATPIERLIADPVVVAARGHDPVGAPHEKIALPRDIYGSARTNSSGLDLSNEAQLNALADELAASAAMDWKALPCNARSEGVLAPVLNPADRRDIVGRARDATPDEIEKALASAATATQWPSMPATERAAILRRASAMMEERMPILIGLMIREAGKSTANAISEVREAVDFLRYYGNEAIRLNGDGARAPLGPVVCISPWNFPLAIFTGQVAAALAAGNAVLAKPAPATPLIAAEAVQIFHKAGVPKDALHLLLGDAAVGTALVTDTRVHGVMFTGSTAVARLVQKHLAMRLLPDGQPVPFIAETGGINAMIVDSSALAEQVVGDVIASAFDSAGQRCSALRVLCVQDDVAPRILAMLKGALQEVEIGNPDRLAVDVGPVISAKARDDINGYVNAMRQRGFGVETISLPAETKHGTFVAPTLIAVNTFADVEREVFGPVLHVLRYRRDKLDALIDSINASGYGLTFGLHSRIDETIEHVVGRIHAGNIYINRNIIGAVVGVQPFGGSGLSGTGPKAGGPLYLTRLMRGVSASAPGAMIDLPGPVGERNSYVLHGRGKIALLAQSTNGLLIQLDAVLATGNTALVQRDNPALGALPAEARKRIDLVDDWLTVPDLQMVLCDQGGEALQNIMRQLAKRKGPIVQVLTPSRDGYDRTRLLEERSISTNTTAAGGNASLMSIG